MPEYFRPRHEELQTLEVGPLAPYLASFCASLSRQGYCHKYGWEKPRLAEPLTSSFILRSESLLNSVTLFTYDTGDGQAGTLEQVSYAILVEILLLLADRLHMRMGRFSARKSASRNRARAGKRRGR